MRLVVVGSALACLVGLASAQPNDDDQQVADRLFFEGRTLLEQNRRIEACAKFELSFKKNPQAIGTLLNLGLCAEMSNLVVTAVRYFAEARASANEQGLKEYQEAADRKIALLTPRMPHLQITLAEQVGSTRVIVADVVVSPDQLRDVTVDPGKRTVVATAPGRIPFEITVDLVEGEHRVLTIPKLEGNRTVIVRTSTRRLWAKVTVGVGAGLVLAGGAFGLYAQHLYWAEFPTASRDGVEARDAEHNCWTVFESAVVRRCNRDGSERLSTARTLGHVGTTSALLGGAALLGGVYLWLTHGGDVVSTTLSLDVLGGDRAGFAVSGAF
jgi:hypothetical protein